jgi:hypothetical protein
VAVRVAAVVQAVAVASVRAAAAVVVAVVVAAAGKAPHSLLMKGPLRRAFLFKGDAPLFSLSAKKGARPLYPWKS